MTNLSTAANQTTDDILATMSDDEIANMTEDEMLALATGVALLVVPE